MCSSISGARVTARDSFGNSVCEREESREERYIYEIKGGYMCEIQRTIVGSPTVTSIFAKLPGNYRR